MRPMPTKTRQPKVRTRPATAVNNTRVHRCANRSATKCPVPPNLVATGSAASTVTAETASPTVETSFTTCVLVAPEAVRATNTIVTRSPTPAAMSTTTVAAVSGTTPSNLMTTAPTESTAHAAPATTSGPSWVGR